MKAITHITTVLVAASMLLSCGTPSPVPPTGVPATVPPTATAPQSTGEAATTEVTQAPAAYPLSEPGPYLVGRRDFPFQDGGRGDRPVVLRVWYPAIDPESTAKRRVYVKAGPDLGGAPYPLILSSAEMGSSLAPYVVSHGFVWAGVAGICTYDQANEEMVDQPLDILFALEQLDANPPEELVGMVDTEHAGAIGYSFDGFNALALSGARIDPAHYLAQCPDPEPTTEAILSTMSAFGCGPADAWDEFSAHAGEAITAGEDGLWQPMTDARIRAVMPMAAEGWWLFGERGLDAVDRPTLMIAGTQDVLYPENSLIFDHLGAPDKALISFVGLDHFMGFERETLARMAHFATAFFGYHLQGREDLAPFFSEDFVSQHEGLAWGVYGGE